MDVAYISDQRFYESGGRWYTTASFPLDFLGDRLGFRTWTFWGRLDVTRDPARLHPIVVPPALEGRIFFEGPRGQHSGPLGHLRGALTTIAALRRLVRRSDVVWLKQPTVFAHLAYPHRRRGQVLVSQQVGDAGAGLALTYPRFRFLRPVSARLCSAVAARADVATFVSRDLAERYGGDRTDLVVANESRVTNAMLALAPGVPPAEAPLRATFVGRLAPEKRVEDLLRAVASVPEVELVVVGDGPRREALEAMAVELGIAQRVTWRGYLRWGSELLDELRRSSVLVLPSATEGLPLVIVEAMSQGLPVIGTRVGGIPELVEDGVTGHLVDVARPDQIAARLRHLASDPRRRHEMGAAALDTARRNTVELQTGRLLDRIRCVVERRAAAARAAMGPAAAP